MALAVEPGETLLWRQPNTTAPPQFQQTLAVLNAGLSVSLVFYGLLTPVCAWSALEWRRRRRTGGGNNSDRTSARVSFWIFAHVAICTATQLSNSIMYRSKFDSRDMLPLCHWLQKMACAGYVGTLGAQYTVLLVRAELTLDESKRWANLVFKLTKLMTITGMPAMMVLGAATFEGAVFYNETCTQRLVLWLVWLFMLSGAGLSACFLLLFILPVYRLAGERNATANSAEQRAATRRLLRTARTNLRLSLVQIVSTVSAQLCAAVLNSAFRDDDGRPENSYFRLVGFFVYLCDLFINTTALLFMSSAWQPVALQRLLRGRAVVQPSAPTPHNNPAEAYIVGAPTAGQASTMITQGGQSIMSSAAD